MKTPCFTRLTTAECRALLRRNTVGRLAFLNHHEVDIEPMHYAFDGKWLFGRTSEGSKLHALAHSPYVAFEVDEVRGVFDWSSAVVHGSYHVLRDDASLPGDRRTASRARSLLRNVVPNALRAGDPAPFRQIVFGIYIDRVEGRAASTRELRPDRAPAAPRRSRHDRLKAAARRALRA